MNKKIISIQISEELFTMLREDSSEQFLTLSAFVRKLLMQYYKEKKNGVYLQDHKQDKQ